MTGHYEVNWRVLDHPCELPHEEDCEFLALRETLEKLEGMP